MKQHSDPPERIVVEMVGYSDRPEGPPGPKGTQAQVAPKLAFCRFGSHSAVLARVLPFQFAFCRFNSPFAILARVLPFLPFQLAFCCFSFGFAILGCILPI